MEQPLPHEPYSLEVASSSSVGSSSFSYGGGPGEISRAAFRWVAKVAFTCFSSSFLLCLVPAAVLSFFLLIFRTSLRSSVASFCFLLLFHFHVEDRRFPWSGVRPSWRQRFPAGERGGRGREGEKWRSGFFFLCKPVLLCSHCLS